MTPDKVISTAVSDVWLTLDRSRGCLLLNAVMCASGLHPYNTLRWPSSEGLEGRAVGLQERFEAASDSTFLMHIFRQVKSLRDLFRDFGMSTRERLSPLPFPLPDCLYWPYGSSSPMAFRLSDEDFHTILECLQWCAEHDREIYDDDLNPWWSVEYLEVATILRELMEEIRVRRESPDVLPGSRPDGPGGVVAPDEDWVCWDNMPAVAMRAVDLLDQAEPGPDDDLVRHLLLWAASARDGCCYVLRPLDPDADALFQRVDGLMRQARLDR